MARVTVRRGQRCIVVSDVRAGTLVSEVLMRAGLAVAHPCGGRGICGKCAVLLTGNVSAPNDAERKMGGRLSCQAQVLGDATVYLAETLPTEQIEVGAARRLAVPRPMSEGIGAAVDIGTTTLALRLYDLRTGVDLGYAAMLNPQTRVAADVIGRIDAAMQGGLPALQAQVTEAVAAMLNRACEECGTTPVDVDAMVLTGNTTMLYLLTRRAPSSLGRAPFQADHLFGEITAVLGRTAYLPPCLHAFVGADTACALLSSGMLTCGDTALLCDIGTNGEIALWHGGKLYVASTAAGPAFEGAGIRDGCGSVRGAIDRVHVGEDGSLVVHTIGEGAAVGICGSGLIDGIAALLEAGLLDETGALDEDEIVLADSVCITQADVRAVQLAKSAMAAGVASLLAAANCAPEEVSVLYLAGGFGSHLDIGSAVRIGLIDAAFAGKVQVIGNAALDGAAMLLGDVTLRAMLAGLAEDAIHVRLDGNAQFSELYVENMFFPE